jgi:hypothetical protein
MLSFEAARRREHSFAAGAGPASRNPAEGRMAGTGSNRAAGYIFAVAGSRLAAGPTPVAAGRDIDNRKAVVVEVEVALEASAVIPSTRLYRNYRKNVLHM